MDLLFRYETFNVLVKYNVESDMQSWIRFAVCDLLEEVKDCLGNFQIEDAILIYSRMDEETVKSLNEKFVNDVLDIFKNPPQDLYQSFLPTFFPITMTHLPSAMSLFLTWLQDEILHMEKRDATNFPENGVKMVEDVLELIRVEKHGVLLRQCMLNRKSLENLSNLLKGLKTLQKLKEMYAIKVELSEYLEGPKKFVSTLLRVSMPPELYNGFLKNFLQIYMLQNDINHNTIFAEEINNLLKCNGDWLSTIEIIFDNISSLDIKLQITQKLLLNSPVPWCDAVKRMADRSLQFSHPMVETISKMLSNEGRYKVIQNREYLINERKLDEQFCRVVNRIVYVDEPQMVDDIFHLCSIDDQYLNATVILVNHFILKEDLDQAIAVLDRNKPEILYRCGRNLFDYAENIIKARYHKASTKEKYYNFLPILIKKLKNGGYKELEMHHVKERFRIMQGQYFFKQHFGIDFTDAQFKSPMEIIQSIDLASRDFTEILQYADRIAFFLSKDTDEILLQLCDSIKKFDILIKAGEYLYETDSSAKNLCVITMLFLKYLGIQNCPQLHTTVFEKIHDQTLPTFDNLNGLDETSENDKFLKGLKLGDKLIRKAMAKDGTDLQIDKVSKWLDVCFYLTRSNSTLDDYLHPNVYYPKQNMPSSTVLQTIQFCFKDVQKDSEYYSVFPSNMELEEELLTETSINTTLASAIDTFCREGQAPTAYLLLGTVANSLVLHPSQDSNVLKSLKLLEKKCLVQFINAVVSAEHIDLELLYNLFLAMPQDYKKYLTHFLQTHRQNFRKLKDLSGVGIALLDFFKDTEGRAILIDTVKSCKWWGQLTSIHSKMIYKEFFKSDPDARLKLVINLDAVGFEEINSFCKDFNLDVDEYNREYLKSSLLNFTPQYKIEKMWDKKVLVVENNEDSLYKKCQKIIRSIKDKARAFLDMVNILKEVNFYYYEVFLTIYKLLEDNTQTTYSEDKKMMVFLKEYTRFGRPSQREKEAWYTTFPDTQILDPLSEFRVPFIPLLFSSEIWSILRPEVSLTSYKLWFNATYILSNNLKVDDICVYAVKNVVSSGILGTYVPNDWKLYSEFDDLLHKVDECVHNIKNLESATSVVYELMNNIPNGADKVKAAELSLKYAVQYRGQNMHNSEVEKTFKKFTNNFYSLSVRHVLHRYNLNKEIYLKLVTQPEILIENLYTDERVSKQTVFVSLDYSDINDAVDAISELFGLDVGNIRFSLLKRWLSSPNDFDMTLTLSPFKNNSFNRVEDDDNLKRAIYICNSRNQQHLETYLLEVVLTEDDLDVRGRNMVFKANAAKCFCAITDEARIIEVTKLSYGEFLKYVDKLVLLSELESLGIMLNIETLNVMSKRELLKKLYHMGKPLAIKCMGAVCMTYFLEEHKYWEYIINCSIKFEMIADLKTYVDFLKNKCDKQFYINAWQVIIDKTFQEIIHVSNEDLEKTLINNFLMIQVCLVDQYSF
ncbi:unnamed protein product [Psylliodes chrysocephalus]|uniref:RZZ complex subunit KNTC1/ROD C-terminal domain-containing protein n=1 Tax=Psylliodes chrysocephalus TaxID=3402493 RepID=A0A9P0G8I9_9CUCU|nr:unnamed protein product [Psylliodes chrysocephala]